MSRGIGFCGLSAALLYVLVLAPLRHCYAAGGSNASAAARLFGEGKYEAAQPLFESLVKSEPTNARARYYLALIYLKRLRKDLARAQLQQVIAISPHSEEARFSNTLLAQIDGNFSASNTSAAADSNSSKSNMPSDLNNKSSNEMADRDLNDAIAQADAIKAHAKSESDNLLAQASRMAKDMEALPAAGRGSHGSAYSQDSINEATDGLKRQAAEALARGDREAKDIIDRAQLRHDSEVQKVAGGARTGNQLAAAAGTKKAESRAVASTSPDVNAEADVPRIDEIAYWNQLKNTADKLELHRALLLKPQYRGEFLSGTSISEIMQKHNSEAGKAADERWVASHQSFERSFKSDVSAPLVVAGYDIQEFVGYRSGTGRFVDNDGMCYKVFFEFKDAQRDLTPELYLRFAQALANGGFVGDSKVGMSPGYVRFYYNNIIVHTSSPAYALIAERIGFSMFRGLLAHHGRGIDVMQSRQGNRWIDPVDWHQFLTKSTDLSELSATALKWVSFSN